MRLIFATQNQNKRDEVQEILGYTVEVLSLKTLGFSEELPETHTTLRENAAEKARFIYDKFNSNCFAEDTGLEVDALNGAPGIYSARYAGEGKEAKDNIQLLLKNLTGVQDRSARFRTVICMVLDNQEFFFEGTVEGRIAEEQRGTSGFGYDPVFIPGNSYRTFGEMRPEEKNTISHRAKAIKALKEFTVARSEEGNRR